MNLHAFVPVPSITPIAVSGTLYASAISVPTASLTIYELYQKGKQNRGEFDIFNQSDDEHIYK